MKFASKDDNKFKILSNRPRTVIEEILRKKFTVKVDEISRQRDVDLENLKQRLFGCRKDEVALRITTEKMELYDKTIEYIKDLPIDEQYEHFNNLKKSEEAIEKRRKSELLDTENIYKEESAKIFKQSNEDINKIYEEQNQIIQKYNEDYYNRYLQEKAIVDEAEKELEKKKRDLQKYTQNHRGFYF